MKRNSILIIIIIIMFSFTLVSCGKDEEGGTNIQESAVDEGDIVKIGNDGLIYNSQSDGISVTQTDKGMMNVIASYSKKNYVPKEMFINGDYLITIGGIATEFSAGELINYNFYYTNYYRVYVNIFNMAAIKALPFGEERVLLDDYMIYSLSLDGKYYTSRLYFETKELYLIFNYSNYIKTTTVNDKTEYIKTKIPYTENGTNKNFSDIEEIKDLAVEHYNFDATLLFKIKLTDEDITATSKGYYGAKFQDLYMSETALYPIFFMNDYGRKKNSCYHIYTPYAYFLKVSRADLQSSHQVKLTNYIIYDRYAIKDFGDVVYICATNQFNGSSVFAYDTNLKELGKLENIALREEIKSVTYEQTDGLRYCYITTFRQTDPLFKIDITLPSEIKLLSALKITGYATYLQVLSDRYMIGIGYDGDQNNANMSILKVSLYDVTDDEIKLINYITISGVINCEALSNVKAIAIDRENKIFGFSVLRNVGARYIQGYYIFNMADQELNDLAYVTNFENGFSQNGWYYDAFRKYISRAFTHDGYVYFVSDSQICSYSVLSLEEGEQTLVSQISTVID